MRLLLDEHFSPQIARRLREKGHDVVAVGEHPELRGRSDRVHFATAPDQRRAIATRNVGDFRPLLATSLRSGARTYGLVCVSARFSLTREGIGRLVRALEALLEDHPDDEALIKRGGEVWLEDPEASRSGSG